MPQREPYRRIEDKTMIAGGLSVLRNMYLFSVPCFSEFPGISQFCKLTQYKESYKS